MCYRSRIEVNGFAVIGYRNNMDRDENEISGRVEVCTHHNLFCSPHYISTNLAIHTGDLI
jgi:hypothetical protein